MAYSIRIVAIAVMCWASVQSVSAAEVDYTTQGKKIFSFNSPDGWEVLPGFEVSPSEMPNGETPTPRIISLKPPQEDLLLWTGVWSPMSPGNLAEASTYVSGLLPDFLEEPETRHTDDRVYGGRSGKLFTGVGYKLGRPVDFAVAVVQATHDRLMVAAFVGEPEAFDRHEATLKQSLESVSFEGVAQ